MNEQALMATAQAMVAEGKGLLAMDESIGTCNQRFDELGIPPTEPTRRAYRELLVATPGLSEFISGAILFDETIGQQLDDGRPFAQALADAGMLTGIKVDLGAKPLAACPGDKVTEGLDGLRERLKAYVAMGAKFAKWRAVITVGEGQPSAACIEANAHALARYAALCQEASLVPIVEPEVLMDGNHTQARCQAVMAEVLQAVFDQLHRQRVMLEGMVLKPAMVLPGADCTAQVTPQAVADATLQCLRRSVPAAVGGIAFLSGGQSAEAATQRLNAMHLAADPAHALPWPLTFSFGRALQQPALTLWAGVPANRAAARAALLHRARCNSAALRGAYQAAMELPG